MTVPRLTMDSKYPGLMLVEVNHNEPCYMTREEARDFGIAVLAATEQGFMRAAPKPDPEDWYAKARSYEDDYALDIREHGKDNDR